MGERAGRGRAELEAELTRLVDLTGGLEAERELSEDERAELRREVRVLQARAQRLEQELAAAQRRHQEFHDELDSVYRHRMELEEAAATEPAETPSEAPPPPVLPEEPAAEETPPPTPLKAAPAPTAIEVRDLQKSFQMPAHQMETLKERALHPLRSRSSQQLRALRNVSFDVAEGEFLGIVGPNGSGKSTLLKLLASVYAADGGTVRVAGRVAPFIELGVGLNPELAAFDNVVVSGVMMGLEPAVARALYPEIIEFAGLEAFTQVKLKNYSSGMRVRLAFAVMAKVDADILLIDEVLAVGDADFRDKCLTRLAELRGEGKTIIFVTHAMETMVEQCDRALLLHHGELLHEGPPAEVADAYARVTQPQPEQSGSLKAVAH